MKDATTPTNYRVIQYNFDKQKGEHNIPVSSFDGLVTHHPLANFKIRMHDGMTLNHEDDDWRDHAFIDGEFQEIEVLSRNSKEGQVLLIKDFILEDPSAARDIRNVDVPSPAAGYIGDIIPSQGLIDIYNEKGGYLIARIRHMDEFAVEIGSKVDYGQSLGKQSDVRTGGKHVHIEMDIRHFQEFRNYVNDLVSGRLPVQASLREGVQPLPVVDDNVARLGESSERVRQVQQAMIADGYRATGDAPIVADGVYRRDLQGAVVAFQQDHGLRQTGDIDQATWQQAMHINRKHAPGQVPTQQQSTTAQSTLAGLDMSGWLPQQDGSKHEKLAPGDVAYGSAAPPDPARTGRAPEWIAHEPHRLLRDHEQPQPPRLWPLPGLQQQPMAAPAGQASPSEPAFRQDFRDPAHPAHGNYRQVLHRVQQMDERKGFPPGPHSEQLAAALLVQAESNGMRINHVELDGKGRAIGSQELHIGNSGPTVSVDLRQAHAIPMAEMSRQWLQARSPHLLGDPSSEQTAVSRDATLVDRLPEADRPLFTALRAGMPAHVGDAKVLEVLGNAKAAGIDSIERFGQMSLVGDRVLVQGDIHSGFARCTTELQPTAADADRSVQALREQAAQREQMLAQATPQPEPVR